MGQVMEKKIKPDSMERVKRLLNITDAAIYLGMSENALRKRVERRQVPFKRLGKRVIFDVQELDRLISLLPGVSIEEIELNGSR